MKELKQAHIKPGKVDITTFCSPDSKAGIKLGEILAELDDARQYAFVRRHLGVLYAQLKDLENLKRYRVFFMKEAVEIFEKQILNSGIDQKLKTFTINLGKAKYRMINNPLCETNRADKAEMQRQRAKKINENHEIEKDRNSPEQLGL